MNSSYSDCLNTLAQQNRYSKPMPWIGLYIAVASLVCTLAMAADVFHGFRHRKFWFPCKYFTLNAASITVIAIAMKLPLDLNNPMPRNVDQLSKVSGMVFMCTMLANFMPSLGPMSSIELLSNLIALGILVITIAVNICIQLSTTVIHDRFKIFNVIVVTFMLSLLVIMVSSALTLPDSKRILEIKYREMHKGALDEESEHTENSIVDKLMQRVRKYWIMAESGSPQFVMACSPTCSACGAMCLFTALILLTSSINSHLDAESVNVDTIARVGTSAPVQVGSIAPVPVGTIAPVPVGSIAPVPVGTIAPVPVGTIASVPVGTSAPVPVGSIAPVPVGTIAPVPVGSIAPVPVGNIAPVPVGTIASVPVGTMAPVPVGTIASVPVGTMAPVPVGTIASVPVGTIALVPVGTIAPVPMGTIAPVPVGTTTSSESDYKWSIILILVIQSIGVVVGSIAPLFRWFSALTFKLSLKWSKNYLKVYLVEKYWTQRLVDWKHIRAPVNIGGRKCKRLVHDVRNLVLNFLIGFQVIIVVVCKTFRLIPIFLVIMLVYFWHCCKWLNNLLMSKLSSSNDPKGTESNQQPFSTKSDLSPYVLQLQDEVELGNRTLRSISKAVNRLIHKAEKQQSNNLMKLLGKSKGFQGVAEFDNDQVPPLQYYQELQALNCWSLVVVTLTSILIALPNIRSGILDLILRGVSKGLSYVSLVEESLCADKSELRNIIKAASDVWLEVELYGKWLDNNLQKNAHKGKTSKEILEWFGEKAKSIVNELEKGKNRGLKLEDSVLQKMIIANSMYRISHTILLDYQSKDYEADEMLFEKLSVMIADILGACLHNLPRVITMKCYVDAIEKREESIRVAARILGETKNIMEFIFGRFDIPDMNPDQMTNIDDWRAAAKHQSPSSPVSSSNNESISSNSAELVLVVQ